jgi:hypothetical protein
MYDDHLQERAPDACAEPVSVQKVQTVQTVQGLTFERLERLEPLEPNGS